MRDETRRRSCPVQAIASGDPMPSVDYRELVQIPVTANRWRAAFVALTDPIGVAAV
ncbi:hypothetical protein ACW9HC_16770 [Nocardia gipuzkoensis]